MKIAYQSAQRTKRARLALKREYEARSARAVRKIDARKVFFSRAHETLIRI